MVEYIEPKFRRSHCLHLQSSIKWDFSSCVIVETLLLVVKEHCLRGSCHDIWDFLSCNCNSKGGWCLGTRMQAKIGK
jgi:hypothetical protein